MSVVALLVILIAIGLVAWLINAYLPLDPTVKKIINVVLIVVAILIVLAAFGILGELKSVRVPQL